VAAILAALLASWPRLRLANSRRGVPAAVGALAGAWLRSVEVTELAKRLEALQAVLLGRKDKQKDKKR